jgi:hypothetical protein
LVAFAEPEMPILEVVELQSEMVEPVPFATWFDEMRAAD